ncbi:MAG: VCBS repeat-containing protein, partial [Bacteroidota bacterium]
QGGNNWERSNQSLPAGKFESSSCVRAADFDQDGDQDLFVGIRQRPGLYGVPVPGYLLENDGNGKMTNVTKSLAPDLMAAGMITDARWIDYDQDGDPDLMVGKEWSTIGLWENTPNGFQQVDEAGDLSITTGWWNCLLPADLDGDGDLDLIAGNHGLNSRFQASEEEPVRMYVNDFDKNGTAEQILTRYYEGKALPFVLRHDLIKQMPHLKKKYLKYASYANQEVTDIFTEEELENTVEWSANELASCVFMNEGGGGFKKVILPLEAQFAPVYSIATSDLNQDGHLDILLSGNLYEVKPEMGRYDADYGVLLLGRGDGSFSVLRSAQTGLRNQGAVRDLELLEVNGQPHLIVAHNNGPVQLYRISN